MRNVFKWHLKHWSKFKIISQKCFLSCPLPKLHKWFCSTKKGVHRALNKKYFQIKFPEPLVQNQNNFAEMVLILPTTKIDQKGQLGRTTWLPELKIEIPLNHIISPNTSSTHVPGLRWVIQGPRVLLFIELTTEN